MTPCTLIAFGIGMALVLLVCPLMILCYAWGAGLPMLEERKRE